MTVTDVEIPLSRMGQALVLTLPTRACDSQADLVRVLADAGSLPAAPLLVLDARRVDVLSAAMARALVEFVQAGQDRGYRCALVLRRTGVAARVMEVADPGGSVPVYGELEQAVHGECGLPEVTSDIVDSAAAEQVLSNSYTNMRIEPRGEQRGMWLISADLGAVRLDELGFRMRFHAVACPLGKYVFAEVLSGRLAYRADGVEQRYSTGDVFPSGSPDAPYDATVEESSFRLAVIDPKVIDGVASGPVRFTDRAAVSTRAARSWRSTYRHLRDDLLGDPEVLAHPLVVGNAARLLAATALATFPNTAITEPTIEDRHDAHPRTLRRAIAFIEANADQDLSVADVARAASVTVRAVQLAFRRHLDTTPMAYLRRVRLDHVRAELWAGDPSRDTVTRVAARWGFGRPSAFAAQYRATYGETPSRTLRGR